MEENSPTPRRGGVFGSILLCLVYWLILAPLRAPFQGAAGSVADSVLMAAIGTAALLLFVKRFQKGKWTHVVYDVFAHIPKYVTEWDEANWLLRWNAQIRLALMGVGVVMALVYIIKEPADKTK